MNELDEVEGTNKEIGKQQGLQYSNKKQQAHKDCQLGSIQLVNSELEEVEQTNKKED